MTSITPALTRTTLQAANALTGNGSTAPVQGAEFGLLHIGNSAGTAGVFTPEYSQDGLTWSPLAMTRLTDGVVVNATTAGETGTAFALHLPDGSPLVRARISTNWSGASPQVQFCAAN